MYFIGIDLAWSYKNNSAGAAIKSQAGQGKLTCNKNLQSNVDIINFILEASKSEPAIIGIDAPLAVPNEKESRKCDRLVSQHFGRYEAGAYPANRRIFEGKVRGEELVKKLKKKGFCHEYDITKQSNKYLVVEVYPHPATINLFSLCKTIKYKKGRVSYRKKGLCELQKWILTLRDAEPSLYIKESFLSKINALSGKELKKYEDFLDSILCAYIVYYAWYWGKSSYEIYGNAKEGCILVPKKHNLD